MSEVNREFLKRMLPKFEEFLEKDKRADNWREDRRNKDMFFQRDFTRESIDRIDKGVLRNLIFNLWSFRGWNNKDWVVEQMLGSGITKIRQAFKDLLYGNKPIATSFDTTREIKMMGAASISEILAHHDHNKYPIWNRRSKNALVKLGIDQSSLPASTQISGSQYENFCHLVQRFFKEISRTYPRLTDLLELDFLLYYVSTVYEEEVPREVEFDHPTVIDQILQLGDGLGFEVDKEFYVTQGCKVDAIWRSRIANLGTVTYAFEVQKSGAPDSAIVNLLRIVKADPTIQKAIIVSTEKQIEKFKQEISSLGEDFRDAVGYFQVTDLQRALEHQESLKEILIGIGLLKSRTSM